MAVKTFTTGEVLTAADTNTYLANSGLQYISSGTFTNAASFDVTGFSSSYDFYQLLMSIQTNAAATSSTITAVLYSGVTARNTNYYGGQWYVNNAGASGTYGVRNNAANFAVTLTSGTLPSLVNAWISGIDNLEFNINLQNMDNQTVAATMGSYSNYAATSSFDMIRFSGTANVKGYWNLMGVRKA
jgi:hypothetical protein